MAEKRRFKQNREFKKRLDEQEDNAEADIRSFKFHSLERKEAKPSRDNRDSRSSRESRDSRNSRDSRFSRDNRDSRKFNKGGRGFDKRKNNRRFDNDED